MKRGKKLLLIEPPFYRLYKDTYALDVYPLSLGYLAAVARRDTDWDVCVYNADFKDGAEIIQVGYVSGEGYSHYRKNIQGELTAPVWNEIRATIRECRPSVIGITSKSQNFASAKITAAIAKQIDPSCVVVVGGPHPTLVREQTLECPDIDVAVFGEGEATLVELLQRLGSGGSLAGVRGICFRDQGRIVCNEARDFIGDLDALPFPHTAAPHVLKDYVHYPVSAFKSIFAIRGCPYHCTFCGSRYLWGRKVRFRSPENVALEIQSLQKMGLSIIRFDDDTFGVNKKYIEVLCETLKKRCPGIRWSSELHVKLVNETTVRQMKQAGCYSIQLGIESGDNGILKAIQKNITIEEALEACQLIQEMGMELQTFCMIGFPQETEETLAHTREVIRRIKNNAVAYSIFTPYPGTELFALCQANKMIPAGFDLSLYNHQSPANYFCPAIPPARFRQLAAEVERMVDRKNNSARLRGLFSLMTFRKIKDSGFKRSSAKALSLIRYYVKPSSTR